MGNYKLSAAAESDLKRIWFRGLDEFGEAQADAYYYRFLERFEQLANQPYIAQWNLARLAETLLVFIDPDRKKAIEIAENCLNSFEKIYKEKWLTMMGSKIGLKERREGDEKLISELLDWMHKNSADFTNTFINLGKEKLPDLEAYATKDFQSWHSRWQERIRKEKQDRTATLALSICQSEEPPLVTPLEPCRLM